MTLETFFDKFNLFADAPDAVAKMRELVLELAVQGRLLAQSANDEPARAQLERIAAKKSKTGRLVRAKAGGVTNSVGGNSETHVPDGWVNAPLGELVAVLNGRAYSKEELLAAGTPVLRVGNLFTSKHWYYSDLNLEPDKYCDRGDLLFAWSASFGPFIWPGPKVIYHYHIWKLELHSEADLNKGYLYWFLQNKTQEIKRAGHGVSMLHMTKEKMEKLEVLIPPIAEQQRIVAKVDELMALCDRLEAQQQEREARQAVLARASLADFSDAPTTLNLQLLFHRSCPVSPDDLRKAILTLAVQGQLVPQDPNEEPAEELLASIDRERLAAIKVRRIGPKKQLPPVGEDELAYDVRPGWAPARLLDLVMEIQTGPFGSSLHQSDYQVGGTPVINPASLKNGKIVPIEAMAIGADTLKRLQVFSLDAGDIVMARRGEMGRCAVVTNAEDGWLCGTGSVVLRMPTKLHPPFLAMLIGAPEAREYLGGASVGTTMQNLNQGILGMMPLGVPPLTEQRRIVTKVEELMAMVDELEAQLAASRATAANLLSAVVAELTAVRQP